MVEAILDVGGAEQLSMTDETGCLPMHLAAGDSESTEVVQMLLDRGGPSRAPHIVTGVTIA